ncbi:tyrosine-type recombinase/integrase [Oceanobacillus sp. CF4.6]|uniref:tyrosine-type recombinase/integrase n=1 Tax=Oceanobacillus sp. CF4.6 TaxID=3373080 RepID=UPI003EE5F828
MIDIGPDPQTGKRRQRSGSRKTKEDAEVAAAALLSDVKQGTYFEESDILFKDFANEWLPIYIERNGVKPGTIRLRQYGINKLLPYFAHLKLKNITEEMYQEALDDLKDIKGRNLARSTKEGIHITGEMIFEMATSKKLIKDDPTENVYINKEQEVIVESDEEEQELPNFFEKEELHKLLDTVSENGLYMDNTIFLTLAFTGIRVGELVALMWKNIDFDTNTISITKTYYNPKSNTTQYQLLPPKTKKSRRKIVVDEEVIEALRKHKMKQEKIIARLGNSYDDKGFIFANVSKVPGYPILIKLVRNRMKRLLKLGGLNTKLTPHSLRHTHTSLLSQAGADIDEIMDRLGHQNDEVTRKVYLHITEKRKKATRDKFGNFMRS